MNRATFNAVAKLRTQDGQFVLMATKDIAHGAPAYQIFGLPVSVNDAVADDKVYVVNIREAYGALIREDAKLSRVAEDSVNLRRGTIQFFLEVDVDAKVKNKQAIVRIAKQ
jgi:HK97 family phage major capsid protein